MCQSSNYSESDVLAHEAGSTALGLGVEAVVNAMSDRVIRDLMEKVIGDMIANAGDCSTLEQFESVMFALECRPVWCYKPDEVMVRAICAAAMAATTLTTGSSGEQATQLARCTVLKQEMSEVIRF